MIKDYTVSFKVRNPETGNISEQTTSLDQYCSSIKHQLTGVLLNIEKTYELQAGTPKKELWAKKDYEEFMKIRRDILNAANNIERLPYNTKYRGHSIYSIPVSDVINEFANKLVENKN